ncbi:MAG TPA: hypothetical protein VEH06_17330 [Candidatus Bathyarchaeia archaeon]|nr:hypothetical protein [Candidatus Bathyarchaeia archaeon]
MKAEYLELSKLKKAELFDFMKGTRDKEEYRRASSIKQKLEGLPYRTIKNLDYHIGPSNSIRIFTNRYRTAKYRVIFT